MNRRSFLKTSAAAACASTLPSESWAGIASVKSATKSQSVVLSNEGWRGVEVTTDVSVQGPSSAARVWLPLPLTVDTDYQRTLDLQYQALGARTRIAIDPLYNTRMLSIEWSDKTDGVDQAVPRTAQLTLRIATRDRHAPSAVRETPKTLQRWLTATEFLPTDGIVRETALRITGGEKSEIGRARAIYDWVVDHTFRDPKTRGCGTGDVRYMLESGNLGGKCADLNAVFVALARSAGIPARDVYGIRTADSARGYKSLGKAGDVTRAQHCRAEFYVQGQGWIPVDPADVRKVILEESGGLPADDAKVEAIRNYLFGNWEMNWLAYNYGHDLRLPGSDRAPVAYLMYPNGETTEGRLDQLDPDHFRYRIASRVIEL